jgi:hypothetical protein
VRRTRPTFAVLALLIVARCSCDEDPPPDDSFDGNVVVGDAMLRDADRPPRDAELEDGEVDRDSGEDGGDATRVDGSDAETSDGEVDAGPNCDVTPVRVLTATEAESLAAQLAGMIVEITGTATTTALSCTELSCEDAGACCNTCTATVTIDAVIPLVASECFAMPPGCTGNECAQVCRPQVLGVPQRFLGRLRDDAALMLFSVSP